jgi:hypothetical protein
VREVCAGLSLPCGCQRILWLGADIALIYVGLGDQDQAMIWLDRAYEARFKASILLRPAFDPLRSDARFKDLKRRIGLPL